ncbi:unnamed protein product [Durusdinium trenchii]|uniref:Uncharacterized protein n=1 Tax=Durusdinium trenchii TaxID=1381693 RepID=A0ABP0PNZ7_9DINO
MLKVHAGGACAGEQSPRAACDGGWCRRWRPRFKAESGLSLEAAAAAAVIWTQLQERMSEGSSTSSSAISSRNSTSTISDDDLGTVRRKRRQRYSCIVLGSPADRVKIS